jgi:hypothetical protein
MSAPKLREHHCTAITLKGGLAGSHSNPLEVIGGTCHSSASGSLVTFTSRAILHVSSTTLQFRKMILRFSF